MITNTYTDGDYKAEVDDNHMVYVYFFDELIDNPGPWRTLEGAESWASEIVVKYAIEGHPQ